MKFIGYGDGLLMALYVGAGVADGQEFLPFGSPCRHWRISAGPDVPDEFHEVSLGASHAEASRDGAGLPAV